MQEERTPKNIRVRNVPANIEEQLFAIAQKVGLKVGPFIKSQLPLIIKENAHLLEEPKKKK